MTAEIKIHKDIRGQDKYWLLINNGKTVHPISIGKRTYEKLQEMTKSIKKS